MADRPINMQAWEVRALLDNLKTQKRLVLKKRAALDALAVFGPRFLTLPGNLDLVGYAPGDRLYVREAHSLHNAHGTDRSDSKRWGPWGGLPIAVSPDREWVAYYREGFDRCGFSSWRPSTKMPRWASRLTLTVTEVRVQRLQEITLGDICAEGLAQSIYHFRPVQCGFDAFEALWNSLHGPEAWDANPWVVALTFTVAHSNIDGAQ